MKRNGIISLIGILLLTLIILAGCASVAADERMVIATVTEYYTPVEAQPVSAAEQPSVPESTNPPARAAAQLTAEEAEVIALEHAGFTAGEVRYLRSEYEIDNGVPQYEVQYHVDRVEYEFEIHAETGAVISFEKDY